MTELDATPMAINLDAYVIEIARLRRALRHHTELTGAAVAVLTAIHKAGGWHVVDPIHQDRMRAALDALESAVEATLNERGGR